MSEARAPHWQPDPLLARPPARSPHFVRMPWDDHSAQAFGPWRLQDKADPTGLQTQPVKSFTGASPGAEAPGANREISDNATDTLLGAPNSPGADTLASDTNDAVARPEVGPGVSEQQLQEAREQAYAQGLKEGARQAQTEVEGERQKEREALRSLMIELRALEHNPQRYFEPLRRLALHLAEQLVRGELSVSGQAVDRLVKSCLDDLGSHDKAVVVMLNPADMRGLQALASEDQAALQLEADPALLPGSVRVRVHDTEIQDFIEHRLEALARRILGEPAAWLQKSKLLHPHEVEPLPESTPKRNWFASAPDIHDAPAKAVSPSEDAEPTPLAATEEPEGTGPSQPTESDALGREAHDPKPDPEPSA